jgi:hypothetical protein
VTSKRCPERRVSWQTRARERTEIRSSPPMMETEIEEEDLLEAEGQAAMSSDGGPIQTIRRNKSPPRLAGEIK